MEKVIVEEICSNLKWYERIFIRIFKNTFIKVYHKTREDIINRLLE